MHKTGDKIRTKERFDCDVLCSAKGEWLDKPRAERACTRIDLDHVTPALVSKTIHRGGWMGRLPIVAAEIAGNKVNPRTPTEDPSEGCPGGWYRSRFALSVLPYMRRRDDHGGRVHNYLLDRSEDDVIYQLAQYTEDEQERYEAWRASEVLGG